MHVCGALYVRIEGTLGYSSNNIVKKSYFEVPIKLYMFCWDMSTDAKDLQLRSLKSLKDNAHLSAGKKLR